MPDKGLSKEAIEQLRKYDSPTVCNVIELFDVQPRDTGYMDDRIKSSYPDMPPMIGYACTATRRPSRRASGLMRRTVSQISRQTCPGINFSRLLKREIRVS